MTKTAKLLPVLALLVACISAMANIHSAAAQASTTVPDSAPRMMAASVKAAPDLHCTLQPKGEPRESGIPVFTDGDGYARFHAVKLDANSPLKLHTLTCTEEGGRASAYDVDLASEETFKRRPLNLANERGLDRPALSGDPKSYSPAQLVHDGYGLRPDSVAAPSAYAAWLEAAKQPGRMLYAKRPNKTRNAPTPQQGGPGWIGSVMSGQSDYISATAVFTVPTLFPGAHGTTATQAALWPGVGGFGTSSGLMQAGVFFATTSTTASYSTWREYCCGGVPDSGGYGGAFTPSPGDKILAQAWYCDSNGLANLNGGYGCNYMYDYNSKAVFNCTQPKTTVPTPVCWSAKAFPACSKPPAPNCMVFGNSAEFIVENESSQIKPPTDQFPTFFPPIQGEFVAVSASKGTLTMDTDSGAILLTDFPHNPPTVYVGYANGETSFATDRWLDRWFRLPDPNFSDQFTIPPSASVTSLSRNPNHIDLFVTGRDGGIYTTAWDASTKWAGHWFRLPDPNFSDQFTVPPGSSVASLSRTPNHIDAFVTGRDGGIYTTAWDASTNWEGHWFRLPDPNFSDQFTIPAGSPVTALSRNANHIDLFVTGRDGGIYTTAWDASTNWAGHWFRLPDPNFSDQFTVPPGSPVAMLSRNPNNIDLFVTGRDGGIYTTAWDASTNWAGHWFRLPDPNFSDQFTIPTGSPVTALARNPNHIDLFVTGRDGAIYTTAWDASSNWAGHWFRLPDPNFPDQFTIPPGSPVAMISRDPNHIDLFVAGREGAIYTTAWDTSGNWVGHWFRLPDPNFADQFTILPGSSVRVLSRDAGSIDLFAPGRDGAVYSTFWPS